MGDRVRGYRFVQGRLLALWPRGVIAKEVKRWALIGTINPGLHATPTRRMMHLLHHRIQKPYQKWAPRLPWAYNSSWFLGKTH
jgi:hypothetical protein